MSPEKKTPTRTALEKMTDEEGVKTYGPLGWLLCLLKAQERHDSNRNQRRRILNEKANEKKQQNGKRVDD